MMATKSAQFEIEKMENSTFAADKKKINLQTKTVSDILFRKCLGLANPTK